MKKIVLIIAFWSTIYSSDWVQQVSPVNTPLTSVGACLGYYGYYNGWLGGMNGVILKTTNSGTNWIIVQNSYIGTNKINCICGITQYCSLVSITTSSASSIYKTSNGGTNWNLVFNQPSGDIKSVRFYNFGPNVPLDTNRLFAVGNPVGGRWSLWKSTNGGNTWDSAGLYIAQYNSETSFYNSCMYAGDNDYPYYRIYFGTNNSRIYYSTNNGANWLIGAVTGSSNIYCVYPNYAGGTSALKTNNDGQTWNPIIVPGSGNISGFFDAVHVANKNIYTRGSEIYESTDNGTTFILTCTTIGNIQEMNLRKFYFEGAAVWGWAVTDSGKIYYYNHDFAGIKKISLEIPKSFSLYQNYPNPFNPNTKIKFDTPLNPPEGGKSGVVTLKIYDILGREVAALVNEKLQPGTYEVEFDGSNYPSGVYFYKLETESFSNTKRMVIIK